ncbi:MAG: phosphoserine phosphatase SerB [Pseudomonadota bacterium]
MTQSQRAPEWMAVSVSRSADTRALRLLQAVLDAQDLKGTDLRELGGDGEQFAAAVNFEASSPVATAVRAALADGIGHAGDTAVVAAGTREKRVLICDMDSTVIGQECLDELADFAGFKAEVSAITERAMRGELDFEAAITERVAMLKGLDLSALAECFETRISLNPGARVLVETMKSRGAATMLVSGGFTFFTERVAKAAGFEQHLGNFLVDDGAALTGTVGRPILGRQAKLDALETAVSALGITAGDVLAMGDGANDLAMIGAAGLGIAYRAKPVVAAGADAAIDVCDLTAALFFQGIPASEFVTG